MTDKNHAEQNAKGWTEVIKELVAALDCDYDRLSELRDEYAALDDDVDPQTAKLLWMEENSEELAELIVAAGEFKSAEEARERIQESPLSVQIRSAWYTPGEEPEPEEFEILLSTGGPALRIRGELDEHRQPRRAWLEYQDWGTPWTHHYVEGFADTILEFCQQFYFGE